MASGWETSSPPLFPSEGKEPAQSAVEGTVHPGSLLFAERVDFPPDVSRMAVETTVYQGASRARHLLKNRIQHLTVGLVRDFSIS